MDEIGVRIKLPGIKGKCEVEGEQYAVTTFLRILGWYGEQGAKVVSWPKKGYVMDFKVNGIGAVRLDRIDENDFEVSLLSPADLQEENNAGENSS